MSFKAKILVDSTNHGSVRLTTWELTYPRFIHNELMTHRVFSRNAASSRAIPVEKTIERVLEDPAAPVWWGKNQRGMQAREELSEKDIYRARFAWVSARRDAVEHALKLAEIGVHKQITNRILEPWMWITTIVTATEWVNFYNLRTQEDAQPEFRHLARMMRDTYLVTKPTLLTVGQWHRPLMPDIEELAKTYDRESLNKISAARCARVSYLTHDGKRDPEADIDLANRLLKQGHMSPFEHVAESGAGDWFYGNLRGWIPYRKRIPGEAVFNG